MSNDITNVVFAGLGGQGILTASDLLADAAFRAGLDVKKSELHGMSQRGGSVSSDVRYGQRVLSPMVPEGEADFLVVFAADQVDNNRHFLRDGGVLITADVVDEQSLPNKRCLNVALVGALSTRLDIADEHYLAAIKAGFRDDLYAGNVEAFRVGQAAGGKRA